jgi:hypothetical protein
MLSRQLAGEDIAMPIMFNTILKAADFRLADVRLLRHKDKRAAKGRSPYEMWRDDMPRFDLYQSIHGIKKRHKLVKPYWAVFVGTPDDETLFVGMYAIKYMGLLKRDTPRPHMAGVDKAGRWDAYKVTLESRLQDLIGRLVIDWGLGTRAWIQRADKQDKPIKELRAEFKEPEFPGFLNFSSALSKLHDLPKDWITALQSSRGVYLLTCPKTKEQYVGSAYGDDGFWHRLDEYVQTGHGGNVALKSRDRSNYQVSILEVAGSAATIEDILEMEGRWKSKLQSREMGLNRN